MNKPPQLDYLVEDQFERFLEALRNEESMEWLWLYNHFTEWVLPWIRKKDGHLPPNTIITVPYFIEEVFSNSLIRFYELFKTGDFENFGQIRGLMFKIADLKLKEGYRKLQRDRLIFKLKTETDERTDSVSNNLAENEKLQLDNIKTINKAIENLTPEDQKLLELFFDGESYKNISAELKISEAACRKRKQRLIERLQKSILLGISILQIGSQILN